MKKTPASLIIFLVFLTSLIAFSFFINKINFLKDQFSEDSKTNKLELVSLSSGLPSLKTSKNIGVNIGTVNDFNGQFMFTDLAKQTRNWITSDIGNPSGGPWNTEANITPYLRSDGFPTQVPINVPGFTYPQAVSGFFLSDQDRSPSGNYTFIFEGNGTIILYHGSQITTYSGSNGGTHQFFMPADATASYKIVSSNINNPIRGIKIIMPGFESTYQTQIFHPYFLELLSNFSFLRAMDLVRTNDNPYATWNQRSRPDYYTQATDKGLAWEYIINLSNELNMDLWINIPERSDDSYVRNLSILLRDNLEPGLKIYVEYSNEIWNSLFSANEYAYQQAYSLGLHSDPSTPWMGSWIYTTYRSVKIFEIFEDEFINNSRLIKIIPSFSVNDWIQNFTLNLLYNSTINPNDVAADALAIAPYFGSSVADQICAQGQHYTITVDDIITRSEQNINTNVVDWINKSKIVAETNNVGLIAYESGQHLVISNISCRDSPAGDVLTAKLIAANRDPRMGQLYERYYDVWFDYGDDLAVFSFITYPSKYGAWGALEYQSQNLNTAPKWLTIQNYISLLNNNTSSSFLPSYLTASNLVSNTINATAIQLTWQDNSNTETGFIIERRILPSGVFSTVSGVLPNTITFTDNGLNASTSYEYRVGAFNSTTGYGWSNTANATTSATQTPPNAPSGLNVIVLSNSALRINWTDNSNNEINFTLQRRLGASGTFFTISNLPANVNSYDDTGLVSNTSYDYRVRANNNAGPSAFSNIAGETTPQNSGAQQAMSIDEPNDNMEYTLTSFPVIFRVLLNAANGSVKFTLNNGVTNTTMVNTVNFEFEYSQISLPLGNYTFLSFANFSNNTIIRDSVNFSVISISSSQTGGQSSSSGGGSGGGSGGSSSSSTGSIRSSTQCNDYLDNDGDNLIDYPQDLGCASNQDNNELDNDPLAGMEQSSENPQSVSSQSEELKIGLVFWSFLIGLIAAIISVTLIVLKQISKRKKLNSSSI